MNHTYRLVLTISIGAFLFGGEVDHYLAWGHPLADSAVPLNAKMNEIIVKVIESLPNDCSCEFAASAILSEFGVKFNSDLEKWIKETNTLHKFKPDWDVALEKSIFRIPVNSPRMEEMEKSSLSIQLDEIINIGGIYIGIDKLSHFTGSGYLYYQSYLVFKENPKVHAEEMAVWFGILGEKSIIGRVASGVFSYADLEANYKGMTLGRNMCEGQEPYLESTPQGWVVTRSFDIREYVNPLWDESFNPSFYYDGFNLTLMPKNTPVLNNLPDYCPQLSTEFVIQLFQFYDSYHYESFSHQFLQTLIQEERIPDPSIFNIRKMCLH